MRSILTVACILLLTLWPVANRADTLGPEELLANAGFSAERLLSDPKNAKALALLKLARAVLIFPNLIKGAFMLGGEGGNGVLMAAGGDGQWSYPAFYTLGSLSFGLQIGGQSSEAIMLVMNDDALEALLNDQVKLGADIGAAAGPVGAGMEVSATTAGGEDIYTYSTASGLFIGASFEGAVIARREDWNAGFYGGIASPRAIVLEGHAADSKADALRERLRRLTGD